MIEIIIIKKKQENMSGWDTADQCMDVDTGTSFPAVNNITVAGTLPHDRVPAPGKFTQQKHRT